MKVNSLFILLIALNFIVHAQDEHFEAYYMTQSVSPQNASAFWFPDHTEVQGVANDGENWFITTTVFQSQTNSDLSNAKMWRIHKSVPLDASSMPSGVIHVEMENIQELESENYTHWGDPDHFRYENEDYILVPIYDDQDSSEDGLIACFKANNLELRSFSIIDERPGWCAVDDEGFLYTSKNGHQLVRYQVNWAQLTSNNSQHDALHSPQIIQLSFPNANYTEIKHLQGGEFSTSGELFYLSSGAAGGCLPIPGNGCSIFETKVGPGSPKESDGIHVFETANWTEIQTSTKNNNLEDHFTFQFDNDLTGQQPQGLTIWNLDSDNAANGVGGKLHVLIFDFDFDILDPGDHEFSMYHFSNIIYVDAENGSDSPITGIGRRDNPFKSFNDAFFYFPVWNGAEIRLRIGTYPDTGVYNKRVLITSEGGSVLIGQQ